MPGVWKKGSDIATTLGIGAAVAGGAAQQLPPHPLLLQQQLLELFLAAAAATNTAATSGQPLTATSKRQQAACCDVANSSNGITSKISSSATTWKHWPQYSLAEQRSNYERKRILVGVGGKATAG
mmetsp:Transcript_124305/g.247801  ORF Transcript_124305/g.247801 Transcript_124305/m.247801 type:complete len:125 (-) Transcript_124305:84-458(-)